MDRPECFEFGMEFMGEPEEPVIRAYIEKLEADAERYQLLRGLIKTKDGLVDAQALLWNAAPERKRLDRYIDLRINAD